MSSYVARTGGSGGLGRVREVDLDKGLAVSKYMGGTYAVVREGVVVGWFDRTGWVRDDRIYKYDEEKACLVLASGDRF